MFTTEKLFTTNKALMKFQDNQDHFVVVGAVCECFKVRVVVLGGVYAGCAVRGGD